MFCHTAFTKAIGSPMAQPLLFPLRNSGYIIASS